MQINLVFDKINTLQGLPGGERNNLMGVAMWQLHGISKQNFTDIFNCPIST